VRRALDALEAVDLLYRWETVVDGEPSSNTYLLNVHDQGPTEWRRYRMAMARQVRRGWVHRRNLDRAGNGYRSPHGHTPPLFGGVADRKLQEPLPSDSLTAPPGQRGSTGCHPDSTGCQIGSRVLSDWPPEPVMEPVREPETEPVRESPLRRARPQDGASLRCDLEDDDA
jgi:hypothetical protein